MVTTQGQDIQSQEDKVLFHRDGKIAVITLNRPAKRNAQDRELLNLLDHYWSEAAEDNSIHVLVLRANGPHFSAGHDLKPDEANQTLPDFKSEGMATMYRNEQRYFLGYCMKWRNFPKPSIAAVQGSCIAAGLMLCWPCDLIVAADDARFGDPVVHMGIPGVEMFAHPWEFGARKAKELLFTGGFLNAEEAEKVGMVNRVVPREKLLEETMALANRIAGMDSYALQLAKRSVNQTLDIMGQSSALQAAFDIHHLGHAHATVLTGYPSLTGLEALKKANK